MASHKSVFYECDSCHEGIVVITTSTIRNGYVTGTIRDTNNCSVCDKTFNFCDAQKLIKHKIQPENEI